MTFCGFIKFQGFKRAVSGASDSQGQAVFFLLGLLLGTGVSAIFRRYRRPSDIIAGILMLYMAAMLVRKALKAFG